MKKFTLFNLFPDELITVTQRILSFLTVFVQNVPSLLFAYNRMLKLIETLDKARSKDKKSQYTIQLLEKDVVRDNAFIRFRDYIKSFLKDPDPTKAEEANKVMEIVKKHGFSLHTISYLRQSTVMQRLIAELKEPVNLQAVTALEGVSRLEAMDVANIEFEILRKEKVDDETSQEYARVYESFRNLSSRMKDLVKYLDLLNEDGYKPELVGIMTSIEKEINDATAIADSRETRKAKDKPAA